MNKVCDGPQLMEMLRTATRWLELNAEAINSLNVFPVPDGDTGTNMLFTLREAVKKADECPQQDLGPIVEALAWGAVMEARGNSGIILSQILRGLAKGLKGMAQVDGVALALALKEGASSAYKAVSKPVEGTLLTVAREASEAAGRACRDADDLDYVLAATVEGARESVARTPDLLPILKEAGVVDAGGQGLFIILEGALKSLRHEPLGPAPEPVEMDAISRVSRMGTGATREQAYGYCTQLVVQGFTLDPVSIRQEIDRLGESTVVVGDERLVRVHTHSFQPQRIIDMAKGLGAVSGVNVQDIDQQHSDILHRVRHEQTLPIATVVVASGQGLKDLFSGLGATVVVAGGQTKNPSTRQILKAIESVPAPAVIVLPNNKNIILTARQAAALTEKKVEVVPTTTFPQGIASILAFNAEAGMKENLTSMTEALSGVRTLEVTRAVRKARVNGIQIEKGESIGLLDGELLASGPGPEDVVRRLASRLTSGGYSLATVYCGADSLPGQRGPLVDTLKGCVPGLEVEVLVGGQPHYDFIISLE